MVLARASIVTPGDWTELDLDPSTRRTSIRNAVRRAVARSQSLAPDAAALIALIGVSRGAVKASVAAVVLVSVMGALVLLAVATNEPTDDPDEQGSQRMLQALVRWWAWAAAFTAVCAVAVGVRRWVPRRRVSAPDAAPGTSSEAPREGQ